MEVKTVNRKIFIGLLFVSVISFSIFVGLTVAAPRNKQKPIVLLYSTDDGVNPPIGNSEIDSSFITTDKPAIFTVSIVTASSDDYPTDYVAFMYQPTSPGNWMPKSAYTTEYRDLSMTVTGYGVGIMCTNTNNPGMTIEYCITVQGEEGTTIQIGSPLS